MFDESIKNKIRESLQPLLIKFEKFFGKESLLDFKLIVDKIHEDMGGKTQYEVIGILDTTVGKFRTIETGWEILTTTDEIVKELTRLITEKKEKLKSKKTLPANA
jgi:ribosome-associated translation inhibitor RaiA